MSRSARAATAADAPRSERVRESAQRVWARVRGFLEVIRPLGWIALGAVIVLGGIGWWLGWREWLIGAVVVAAIIVLCVPFLLGRTTYRVELDLTRSRVVVGERAVGALTLHNTTNRAILPSQVTLPVGSGRGVFDVPRLNAGAAHEEIFAIPTSVRCVLAVGPVSVLRGDPLGLFERTHDRKQAVSLYVHPKTAPLEGLSLGEIRDLEGLPARHLARDDVSFHALREYQPGDDLRHVHWKSTARIGNVMVREYEQTRRSHFIVGLSSHPAEYRNDDEFELAVSVAGSVGVRALRDARTLEARTQDGQLRAHTAVRFLDSLSAVAQSLPRKGTITTLAGAMATHAPSAALVVLVSGSHVDSSELRRACSRIPAGTRVLAVTCDTQVDSPTLRRVGDADVITLGALEHLAPSMQRVLS